ncbi:unnamed protein product [Chrysoparadoxa australica]
MAAPVAPYLLSEFELPSGLKLKNRVVLAPLTRGRSGPERIPNEINLEYYVQRAGAGLVITEGTTFSGHSQGWAQNASIWTDEQVAGWKKIVDAVHDKGGIICCQVWHIGRAGHSSFQEGGAMPVGPSAIAITGDGLRDINDEKVDYQTPRALETEEVVQTVQDFKKAVENCKAAGFDMVEIHSANGYLLDEFAQTCSNKRTDQYGGSLENRFRLLKEVLDAAITVYPANRLAVRLSPNGAYNGMGSEDNLETFTYFAQELNKYGLGYLHVMDGLGTTTPMHLPLNLSSLLSSNFLTLDSYSPVSLTHRHQLYNTAPPASLCISPSPSHCPSACATTGASSLDRHRFAIITQPCSHLISPHSGGLNRLWLP